MSTPDYQIKSCSVENDSMTIEVEVAQAVVTKAFKRVHKQLLQYVNVPGFRAGKAPIDVLKRRVGEERFQSEVESELLPKYYYRAVEEQERRPVAEVEYEEKHLVKGEPFTFSARVEVAPSIELGNYDELELGEIDAELVNTEQIDKQLHGLRRRMARLSTPEDGASVGENDLVRFKYEGKVDGRVYKTLSSVTSLLIGDDDFLPGFGSNLIGMARGDEKMFSYTVAADYESEHLRGKDVEFTVKVLNFQHAQLPGLDDEFAKDVGAYTSLSELQQKIELDLAEQAKRKREEAYATRLREKLAEFVTCEIPKERLEREVDRSLDDIRERFQKSPISFEDHLAEEGKDLDGLRKDLGEREERDMKVNFALDQIGLKENLSVSDGEVERRIALTAQVLGRDVDQIKEILDATGSRILKKYDLFREKAFSLLKERYRIKAGMVEASDEDQTKQEE